MAAESAFSDGAGGSVVLTGYLQNGSRAGAPIISLLELRDASAGQGSADALPPSPGALGGNAGDLRRAASGAYLAPCSSFVGSISELLPAGSTAIRSSGLSFWIAMYCSTFGESEALSLRLASA